MKRSPAPTHVDPISMQQGRYVMQCWSSQRDYAPLAVERAEGCWIHTRCGRRIFDLRSAHECVNLGFNHPRVLAAMRRQMEQVCYVTDDFATEATATLGKMLAELTPGGDRKRTFFSQSGAAAVEAAVKAARMFQYHRVFRQGGGTEAPRQYPYPYKIISRYQSWHGATAGAASVSGDPRRWFQEPLSVPGVVFAPDANAYRPHFGGGREEVERNLAYLDYLIEQEGGSSKVAAMIVEPVVGSNGIIPAPPGYLEGVRDLCDRWNLLMIVDETMTGLGRTGRLFAIENDEVVPDILVMGKALGAYCPLGATVFSEKVAAAFEEEIFGHGQSYSGHALACAGAVAALEVVMEPGFLERVRAEGEFLGRALRDLASRHPCVGDVRGLGFFWTLELVRADGDSRPLRRATEKYEPTVVREVSEYLFLERDVYVPSDKFGLWVVPPLVATREELGFVLEALDDALGLADRLLGG